MHDTELARERHQTIQLLRDVDTRAVKSGRLEGGFEHRRPLYLPVALRPAKTALTRYFASHKALVISACRVPY